MTTNAGGEMHDTIQSYEDFIASKRLVDHDSGFDVEDSATNQDLFPFQRAVVKWALRRGRAAVFGATGTGKALANGTPILTPTGWVKIEQLCVGSLVVGSDGKPYPVTGVYPQGCRELYEIVFSDKSSIQCDGDHLWTVNTRTRRSVGSPWLTKTTKALMGDKLKDKYGGRKWAIPVLSFPAKFLKKDFPIDPYTLGVLLGDGCLQGRPEVTTDDEIALSLVLPRDCHIKPETKITDNVSTYAICGRGKGYKNQLTEALRHYGLFEITSKNKFVPQEYMWGDTNQRLELLRGLLDTDGTVSKPNTIEFNTSSEALAKAVTSLTQSLGGLTKPRIRQSPQYTYKGEQKNGIPNHRITIQLPNEIVPFKAQRRVNSIQPREKYFPLRQIDSISECGVGYATCISVASPDQLFVAKDFIVTHNTPIQLEWARHVHGHTGGNVLIFAPLAVSAQTKREGEKFGVGVNICRKQNGMSHLLVACTGVSISYHLDIPDCSL